MLEWTRYERRHSHVHVRMRTCSWNIHVHVCSRWHDTYHQVTQLCTYCLLLPQSSTRCWTTPWCSASVKPASIDRFLSTRIRYSKHAASGRAPTPSKLRLAIFGPEYPDSWFINAPHHTGVLYVILKCFVICNHMYTTMVDNVHAFCRFTRFTFVTWLYVIEWCEAGKLCSIIQHLTWDDFYMTTLIFVNSEGMTHPHLLCNAFHGLHVHAFPPVKLLVDWKICCCFFI